MEVFPIVRASVGTGTKLALQKQTPVWSRSCRGPGMMADAEGSAGTESTCLWWAQPTCTSLMEVPVCHRNTRQKAAEDTGDTVVAVLGRKE